MEKQPITQDRPKLLIQQILGTERNLEILLSGNENSPTIMRLNSILHSLDDNETPRFAKILSHGMEQDNDFWNSDRRRGASVLFEKIGSPEITVEPKPKIVPFTPEEKAPQRRAKSIDMYNQGYSVREIAVEKYIPESTVYGYLKDVEKRKNEQPTQRRAKSIDLYKQGIGIEEIAKEQQVHRTTIYNDVKDIKRVNAQRERKPRKSTRKATQRKIKTLEKYMNGDKVEDIARDAQVALSTIYEDLKGVGKRQSKRLSTLADKSSG